MACLRVSDHHMVFPMSTRADVDRFVYAVRYTLRARIGLYLQVPGQDQLAYNSKLGLVTGDFGRHRWKETMAQLTHNKVFEQYVIIVDGSACENIWDTPGLRNLLEMGNYGPLRVALFTTHPVDMPCPWHSELRVPITATSPQALSL